MSNAFESLHAISNYDSKVIGAMETYGGSFVKQLAVLFRLADAPNYKLLKATFPAYWKQYVQMAYPLAIKNPALKTLTETELKVACTLHLLGRQEYTFGYGNCYWPHNSIIGGDWVIDLPEEEVGGKKGLSKILKKLRGLGIVTFQRGLMSEEGEVQGSGHAPHPDLKDDLQAVCEARGWE